MIEPLSVAGLTIAVVDGLIKYGEWTAELISDTRGFANDSNKLYQLAVDENVQSRLLRNLLFSECWVYGGKTLYEQFNPNVQSQIELLFAEVESILREGVDLLERRYGVSKASATRSTGGSSASLLTSLPNTPSGRTSPSIPVLLRWSLRDKKQVETILLSLKDRNSRLKRKVELWCLTSQLGISPDHLKHLQTDESSKKLDFDRDATLRLAQQGKDAGNGEDESLELSLSWDPYLREITPVKHQGAFTVLFKESQAYIQENHRNYDLDSRTRNRVESLARLLHKPKEQIFRILPCIGWRKLPNQDLIAFLFELQSPLGAPVSLQRILFESELVPTLGDKFRLALRLAQYIAQIHIVQWVHGSFRSDNILLLPHHVPDDPEFRLDTNYSEPWVLGFKFSRPELFFSSGHSDFEPTRDIYRHPDRQGQPIETFKKFHDIHSLGVVLLEIGLWEPARKLERKLFAYAADPAVVRAQLIKHAQRRLESRIGKRYKHAILRCLTGDFRVEDDTREDIKLQQAFRHQVLDVIEVAANSV
ncbi:hypothetical protein BDW74DRAFT_186888 [Aspergillus multicolor]|uniref:uncharacterized protein n=1 Tax=Aspergillus multicolor TaxID=41759 RepID=UPI003CCE4C86